MSKQENIKLNETVKVIGLKGSKHLQEGKEYVIHPIHAERLIKNKDAKLAEAK